jgi:L-iditol 2-dehydrogenase
MHRGGAFAEYVRVPTRVLIPWPEELSAQAASLAEPLGNGVHIVNLTRHLPVRTALVIGAGPIGLMCQQALQAMRGVSTMVCDLSMGRLAVAQKLGATRVVSSKNEDVAAAALVTARPCAMSAASVEAGSSMIAPAGAPA